MHNPFLSIINSLLPEPQASLLNGILFGTKAAMTKEFYTALRDSGVLHVIALSGTNISIIIDLLAKATLFMGKKVSVVFTLILIIVFVWFVGASPSVVRAAIMGSMTLIAIFFGRQDWGLLSLFIASGMMLLIHADWLKDISFQLSFLATLGIILANNIVERKQNPSPSKQLIYIFKENLAMSLSAQFFTLPVILYNFHRLSLVAPLANLLTGWVVQPIMILGFGAAFAGIIWLPLGFIPAWIAWVPLTYFVKVVELLSRVPGAAIEF